MQKPKNNKKTNTDILNTLFRAEGAIAFLDAEFNAGMDWRSGENVNEVISLGVVICDSEFNELEEFYSLVNPKSGKPIFPMISQITGITGDMLKNQPGFAAVSDRITELMEKYGVTRVYTWGNADQHVLLKERNSLKARRYASADHLARWKYIDLCTDISGAVSGLVLGIRGGLAINMENLMFVCEIEEKQVHNALSDAFYLYRSMAYLSHQYPPSVASTDFRRKKEWVNTFYQERSTYNSFRRFKASSRGNDLYGKWDEVDERDMRIKALEDDLAFLKGEIDYDREFDSIQEYFARKSGK